MPLDSSTLESAVARAATSLKSLQKPDGHFVFELEADATIPAEYLLLEHFLDLIDPELERKIGVYLRRIQGEHGGWPLFHAGKFDLSASVKAYFALKMLGDDPDAPHMRRAREAILAAGGAERSNVFTRAQLALYGQVPWRAVPVMPVELMIVPRWFPITIWKISYWSRTVLTPLLVLMATKPCARNPRNIHIPELFRTPPAEVKDWIRGPYRSAWGHFFKGLDSLLRVVEPHFPNQLRERSIATAVNFITERLNGEDGLGAIYPAMANAVMMYDTLGFAHDHPDFAIAWQAVQKLLVRREQEAYCQPCLSPIWDTSLAGHAVAETDGALTAEIRAACDWLMTKEIVETRGDWAAECPDAPIGGWAFQYENDHYPDVDDTAVVGMLLARNGEARYEPAVKRARDWIVGMQSKNGGWGAFDANNDRDFLNHIPFADHGALLDPPTADVTARCVSFLAQIGEPLHGEVMARALDYLRREQEVDGSWFGRWGTNYIYGTWSVLCALNAAGLPHGDPSVRRAVAWLIARQRDDGGWGEDCESYGAAPHGEYRESTPSQTAWAVLGLMAAGERFHSATKRGIEYLLAEQKFDGTWDEEPYTAVGFPRVFYLRYHGYKLFFPLLALSRFQNLLRGNQPRVAWGF